MNKGCDTCHFRDIRPRRYCLNAAAGTGFIQIEQLKKGLAGLCDLHVRDKELDNKARGEG